MGPQQEVRLPSCPALHNSSVHCSTAYSIPHRVGALTTYLATLQLQSGFRCRLGALLDVRMQSSAPDASPSDDALLANRSGSSAEGNVLMEGLAVGQGNWPMDR